MAITPVNIGRAANDGTGDPIRTAFGKVNQSLTDLDLRVAALNGLDLTGGTGETLPYGSTPTISVTGDAPNKVINIGIPAGEPGAGAPTSPDIMAAARYAGLLQQLAAIGINQEPAAALDFARDAYCVRGRYLGAGAREVINATAGTGSTFTRASSAWYFDQFGVLQQAGNHIPRVQTDAETGRRGFLVEPASTNSVVNCTMAGLAAGSPGGVPTWWQINVSIAGLTRTLSNVVLESGLSCIDISVSGTPGADGSLGIIPMSLGSSQPAAAGQVWTTSFFASLIAGSMPGNVQIGLYERETSGAYRQASFTNGVALTAGPIASRRYACTRTLTDALTTRVTGQLMIAVTAGVPVDFTIRVACPQLEQQPYATSPIVSAGVATTRVADGLYAVGGIPGVGGNEGTILTVATQLGEPTSSLTRHIGVERETGGQNAASTILTTTPYRSYGYAIDGTALYSASPVAHSGRSASLLGYSPTGFAYSANASVPNVQAGVGSPGGYSRLRINPGPPALIERLVWFPKRLTDAQLQALSNLNNWS